MDENALREYVMRRAYGNYLRTSVKKLKGEIEHLDFIISKAETQNDMEKLTKLKSIREQRLNAYCDMSSTIEELQAAIAEMLVEAKDYLTPVEHIVIHLCYIEGLNMLEVKGRLQTDENLSCFAYERSSLFRIKESALVKLKFKDAKLKTPLSFDPNTEPYCTMCGLAFEPKNRLQWCCDNCKHDNTRWQKNGRFCKKCGKYFDRSQTKQGKYCLNCLKEKGLKGEKNE